MKIKKRYSVRTGADLLSYSVIMIAIQDDPRWYIREHLYTFEMLVFLRDALLKE